MGRLPLHAARFCVRRRVLRLEGRFRRQGLLTGQCSGQLKMAVQAPIAALVAIQHEHAAVGRGSQIPRCEALARGQGPQQQGRRPALVQVENEQPLPQYADDQIMACRDGQAAEGYDIRHSRFLAVELTARRRRSRVAWVAGTRGPEGHRLHFALREEVDARTFLIDPVPMAVAVAATAAPVVEVGIRLRGRRLELDHLARQAQIALVRIPFDFRLGIGDGVLEHLAQRHVMAHRAPGQPVGPLMS